MAVFRVERNSGYTVMSNHHLRNKELTLKAKGLLSQMLSLPEDWDYPSSKCSFGCPMRPCGVSQNPFAFIAGAALPERSRSCAPVLQD